MEIKRHMHINWRGRIEHPYLFSWSPQSTLVELISQLCAVFSKDPRLFFSKKDVYKRPMDDCSDLETEPEPVEVKPDRETSNRPQKSTRSKLQR